MCVKFRPREIFSAFEKFPLRSPSIEKFYLFLQAYQNTILKPQTLSIEDPRLYSGVGLLIRFKKSYNLSSNHFENAKNSENSTWLNLNMCESEKLLGSLKKFFFRKLCKMWSEFSFNAFSISSRSKLANFSKFSRNFFSIKLLQFAFVPLDDISICWVRTRLTNQENQDLMKISNRFDFGFHWLEGESKKSHVDNFLLQFGHQKLVCNEFLLSAQGFHKLKRWNLLNCVVSWSLKLITVRREFIARLTETIRNCQFMNFFSSSKLTKV